MVSQQTALHAFPRQREQPRLAMHQPSVRISEPERPESRPFFPGVSIDPNQFHRKPVFSEGRLIESDRTRLDLENIPCLDPATGKFLPALAFPAAFRAEADRRPARAFPTAGHATPDRLPVGTKKSVERVSLPNAGANAVFSKKAAPATSALEAVPGKDNPQAALARGEQKDASVIAVSVVHAPASQACLDLRPEAATAEDEDGVPVGPVKKAKGRGGKGGRGPLFGLKYLKRFTAMFEHTALHKVTGHIFNQWIRPSWGRFYDMCIWLHERNTLWEWKHYAHRALRAVKRARHDRWWRQWLLTYAVRKVAEEIHFAWSLASSWLKHKVSGTSFAYKLMYAPLELSRRYSAAKAGASAPSASISSLRSPRVLTLISESNGQAKVETFIIAQPSALVIAYPKNGAGTGKPIMPFIPPDGVAVGKSASFPASASIPPQ